MLRYDATKIGSYNYHQKDKDGNETKIRIEMRSGNCDSVHIWVHKEQDGKWYHQLFNFVGDAEHLRNMTKNGHDIFKDCTDIHLNVYFEQNIRLMKYATKFGHRVTCYYKEV